MKCSPETPGWNSASVVTVNDLPGDRWHRQLTINCHYCSIVSTEQICDCCITWINSLSSSLNCVTKATVVTREVWAQFDVCAFASRPTVPGASDTQWRSVWCLYILLRSTNFTQSGLYVYMVLVTLFCIL